MVRGELEALLTTEIAPDADPVPGGKKVTVRLILWPGVNVIGRAGLLRLNPVPERPNCEIVTLAVPVLVRVIIRVSADATATLPKARLLELGVSWYVAPVPAREIVIGEPEALLMTETVPAAKPVCAGAKATLRVALWLGVRVTGKPGLMSVNPTPLADACEMTTAPVPVLVRVSVWTLFVETPTLPKLRAPALGLSW
jgi:hypothetical protein